MARPKRTSQPTNLRQLLGIYQFILKYKGYFISGLVCLFCSNLTLLAIPYFTGQLLDAPSDGEGLKNATVLLGLLCGILVVQSILSFFRIFFFARVSQYSIADLRRKLYEKYLYLPFKFYDSNRIGDLLSRISSDITIIQDAISLKLAEFIRQVTIFLAGLAIIFISTPRLTVFMLLVFPVIIVAALILGRSIKKITKQRQDSLAKTNIIVEETLQALTTVKSFTNEPLEFRRYTKQLRDVVALALRVANYRGVFASFIIFAILGSIILVLWYGTLLVQSGELTSGDLLSFVLYMMFIGGSVAGFGDLYSTLKKTLGASERVLEILKHSDEREQQFKLTTLKTIADLRFEQVYFSYPTRAGVEVLKNINLKIRNGEKIALVGASGAGKSTLAQLLLRFYDLKQGQILLNDQPITAYNLEQYRAQIGYVSQEIILFGTTIRENILYGKPDADEKTLWRSIEQANAKDFIDSFPEGLETLVGERGIKLSGGQKQRIAIARTFLKNPKILILDEATSALDAHTEQYIQQSFQRLMHAKTTIIIAHRLSTIRAVDRIYVLDGGMIKEVGNHQTLFDDPNSLYHKLVTIQMNSAVN